MKKITFLSICILMVTNLFAANYYVKTGGSDTANGLTEATAFATLSKAQTAAADGDRIYIVGSISHTTQLTLTKALTFTGMSNAVITGGSSRMFVCSTASKPISFSGITFQNVNLTVATNGAVFAMNAASSLSFENCVFNNNKTIGQGGVTEITGGGSLTVTNCTFTNNVSTGNGGAINIIGTATNLTISGSTFTGNSTVSGTGGAINAIGSAAGVLSVTTSLFSGNIAGTGTTGTSAGGAIYVANNLRQALISYSTFYNNTALLQGGAIFAAGTNATSKFTNITCFENKVKLSTSTTDKGGAMRIEGDRPFTIENSLVYGNLVATSGTPLASDLGVATTASPTSILTLTKSLFGVSAGLDAGDSYATSIIAANLASSNLIWDGTIGKVTYGLPTTGAASPIDFGSDGKDVGAWDYVVAISSLTSNGTTAITQGCGGSTLVIKGTNLTGATAVKVNGVAVASFVVTDASTITATIPAESVVAGKVVVTTPGGTGTSAGNFAVNANVTPTFDAVAAICSGATLSALPTTSNNGITGTWSPALNNSATTEYTFTPNSGQCGTTTTMTITVNPSTTTGSVTQEQTGGTYTWPANGVTYTESTNTTFISGCNTATLNLTILASTAPTISALTSDGTTAITEGCGGSTLIITGADFSGATAVTVNGVAVASYIVDSSTQITATLPAESIASGAVTVTTPAGTGTSAGNFAVNAIVTPTFTAVAAICSGATLSALPTTSNNSITGTWSPALNNTATTEYTFTPTAGLCATTATMTITVNANVTPTFTAVAAICSGASLSALPTTSNNSITGTWSPELNNTATTIYTFTPTAGLCATTATMTITVNTCPDTFTWTGSSSNDWATAANWTKTGTGPDGYPGQTPGRLIDTVVINNGGTPVVASGTYQIYSLAINNATGGDTGSILTINSGATLTVNNTSVTGGDVAVTLKGGSIVNNGTLNATATNTGASFGIACLVPSVAPSSATEYGYSGSGTLNISTTLGNASSGGIQFNGTSANTTYKMLFNGTTTFNLNNTALAVYALRVVDGAKNPIIIGGAGFTLGTVGAPVNYGLLIMGNNGNNVTVNTGTTLTLNSAATNTALGINILQTNAASTDVTFTNKGTVAILGASSTAGINLSIDNSTNTLPAINKINFENQGTVNVDVAVGSSSNNAALRVQGAGTTAGLVTITNTATGVLNLKNSQPFTAVTGFPIRIFSIANTPAVTINNAGTLTLTGQNINFGGSNAKSSINNTGTLTSSSEFQNFTVTNGTAGTINFNYNTPATSRSVTFTVAAGVAATAGATYTDVAGNVYTVVFTKTGTTLVGSFGLAGTTTPAPASLTKTSGTGDATIAYTGIVTAAASPSSASNSNSIFTNNGTVNTGTATNLNTFASLTTSATSVIAPGGTSGVGNTVISNASTVALNGTLKLEIQSTASSTSYDQITNSAAGGGFNISNATLDLTGIFTPVGDRTISILTTNATGTLTGNFASVIGLESNPRWQVIYTTGTAGKVQLVYTGPTTWTGTTSTDWTTATNWNNGVPTGITDVTIADVANKPVIASNVSINSLTLNASASLTVSSGFNLTVAGAVANNGGTMTIENNANLIQGGTTNTNTGNVIVKRNSNPLYILDYTMWSSPVSGTQTLAEFSPMTSIVPVNRFYTYNPTSNLYANVASTSTFTTGTGYLIRMPKSDNTNYNAGTAPLTYNGQFTGIPNNGTLTLSGLASDKFYSVGNPYPSTISADAFISGNSTGGMLYFWRKRNAQAGSAYATYNSLGGTASGNASTEVPNGTIQVGQGFIVKTAAAATTLAFTNAMRVGTVSTQIFKTKQVQKDRVWVNLTRPATKTATIDIPEAFSQALIGYMDGATLGVDEGIDGKYINDSKVALTSNINDEEYTIQGRPKFDPADVVALNFKTDADSEYTIALDHFDGVFAAGQDVYLVDSKTGTETDLKAGAYTFNATTGVDNTRFSLKYQKTLKVDAPAFNENSVSVYKNNGALYVNSGFVTMSNIKVFDIQGRLVAEQKNLKSTTAVFNNLRAKNQVLIVKITGENNNVVSKKIVN